MTLKLDDVDGGSNGGGVGHGAGKDSMGDGAGWRPVVVPGAGGAGGASPAASAAIKTSPIPWYIGYENRAYEGDESESEDRKISEPAIQERHLPWKTSSQTHQNAQPLKQEEFPPAWSAATTATATDPDHSAESDGQGMKRQYPKVCSVWPHVRHFGPPILGLFCEIANKYAPQTLNQGFWSMI